MFAKVNIKMISAKSIHTRMFLRLIKHIFFFQFANGIKDALALWKSHAAVLFGIVTGDVEVKPASRSD